MFPFPVKALYVPTRMYPDAYTHSAHVCCLYNRHAAFCEQGDEFFCDFLQFAV